jgi:hypothetical protein
MFAPYLSFAVSQYDHLMTFINCTENTLWRKLENLRIGKRLDTNEALLPSQRTTVKSPLEESEVEQVQSYDTEIERLQNVIKPIRNQKADLTTQLRRAKSLLAPV